MYPLVSVHSYGKCTMKIVSFQPKKTWLYVSLPEVSITVIKHHWNTLKYIDTIVLSRNMVIIIMIKQGLSTNGIIDDLDSINISWPQVANDGGMVSVTISADGLLVTSSQRWQKNMGKIHHSLLGKLTNCLRPWLQVRKLSIITRLYFTILWEI